MFTSVFNEIRGQLVISSDDFQKLQIQRILCLGGCLGVPWGCLGDVWGMSGGCQEVSWGVLGDA